MIKYATQSDIEYLKENDHHISFESLTQKINNNEYLIALTNKDILGYLRFNYFWDNTPFVNMLFVNKEYRKKGLGKELMSFFEAEMRNRKYETVMTSTLSVENAQHFYRKLGYKDAGCLILEDEALEIIFVKKIASLRSN